jgi:hypothetical protein
MTEDLGTPTRPHALTGEQWRLEVRTDDPPSPSADERWIRSDLDGGDRVATLKCGDGTEIPLFPTGTAEETVREARRYRVGGQTVYAPLAPVAEAAFPARRVQHDGQIHAFHDRVAPGSAIPDSVVSRPDDDDSFSNMDEEGMEIELKSDWPSIGARISNNTIGATRAYLRESDGTAITDIDISGLSSGDAFTFDDVNLSSGNRYWITLSAEGSSWTLGFRNGADNYPYTSDDIDITARVLDGSSTQQGNAWAINDIGNVGF